MAIEHLHNAFASHRPEVQAIVDKIQEGHPAESIKGHIATAEETWTYHLQGDRSLVAKIIKSEETAPDSRISNLEQRAILADHLNAMAKGIGRAGLGQLRTYWTEGPTAFLRAYEHGLPANQLAHSLVLQKVPDEHYKALADTVTFMNNSLIRPVMEDGNDVLYHPDTGFTIADYQVTPPSELTPLSGPFKNMVLYLAGETVMTAGERLHIVQAPAMQFRNVFARQFGDGTRVNINDAWKERGLLIPEIRGPEQV